MVILSFCLKKEMVNIMTHITYLKYHYLNHSNATIKKGKTLCLSKVVSLNNDPQSRLSRHGIDLEGTKGVRLHHKTIRGLQSNNDFNFVSNYALASYIL